jgi:hypothetical protein
LCSLIHCQYYTTPQSLEKEVKISKKYMADLNNKNLKLAIQKARASNRRNP